MRTARTRPAPGPAAFTIIELLMVILVLAILIALAIPTIHSVRLQAFARQTQARVTELDNAIRAFQLDRKYIPGQLDGATGGILDLRNTAPQVLGACLFGYDSRTNATDPNYLVLSQPPDPNNPNSPYAIAKPNYAPLLEGDLIRINGWEYSISDRFGASPMAILYFPSRPGVTTLDQYIEKDNVFGTDRYLNGDDSIPSWFTYDDTTAGQADFYKYIKDRRFRGNDSTAPYNSGEFLLIGAGVDRRYGTVDDLRNW